MKNPIVSEVNKMERNKRKVRVGVVSSDKMDKTRVVEVQKAYRHRKYKKTLRSTTKLYVHDDKNISHTGDTVKVMETRPISKQKRWRPMEVVQKS